MALAGTDVDVIALEAGVSGQVGRAQVEGRPVVADVDRRRAGLDAAVGV